MTVRCKMHQSCFPVLTRRTVGDEWPPFERHLESRVLCGVGGQFSIEAGRIEECQLWR